MNKITVAMAAVVLAAVTAQAGFKMPKGTFTIPQLEPAVEEAKKDGKPITFLVTDTETKCPLCEDASKDIIKRMRSDTVLVYSASSGSLPPAVQTLLKGQNTGRFIPYAIVTDAGMTALLGIVRYEDIKEHKARAFRDVEKAVKDYRRENAAKPAGATPPTSGAIGTR